MRVLFLALGATRRRAVVEESGQVVADGCEAVVLVDSAAQWSRETLFAGVRVLEVALLERQHPMRRAETLLLYKGPQFLFDRVIGRGRLGPQARRASRAYQKRIADRVHRRLFKQARSRAVAHQAQQAAPFDVLVVTDVASMPVAVELLGRWAAEQPAGNAPAVAYSIDHVRVSPTR